jgi:hypothetical protein
MKKLTLLVFLLLMVIYTGSAHKVSYIAWGNSFFNSTNVLEDDYQASGGHMGVLGTGFNLYNFWNNNWGMFLDGNFLFSIYNTRTIKVENYKTFCVTSIFGPVYRYSFNNKLTMLLGLGISFYEQGIEAQLDDKSYEDFTYNFGLGGKLGLKRDFTNTIGMVFALNPVYTFANYMQQSAKWGIISKVGLSSFIGMSINYYGY